MIFCYVITIPVYLISVITWLKNRSSENDEVTVNKLSVMELVILLISSIPLFAIIFFVLRALNTANLVVSTISLTLGAIASYLLMRRCEYNFIFYILLNVTGIALWTTITIRDLSNLPTVISYSISVFLNITGLINWIKMKKSQQKGVKNEQKQ